MLHKEGTPTIILSLLVSAILLLSAHYFAPILWYPALVISLFLIVIVLQFFRNPSRQIASKDNAIFYAPADGKVVIIEETFEAEYFKDQRLLVSIFMSPLNVHVNRVPFDAQIDYFKYHAGKYLVAWHPKSSLENERTTVVFKDENKSVLVRQIAGALARRIVCYPRKGDQVKQGKDFGFIKFGSRVDIYLPLGTPLNVQLDQVVKGNIDQIARF